MKLSTKGRYGARALLDLAMHDDVHPVPLKDIARRQAISVQYLEQLLSPLTRAGILRTSRGARGGVNLAKPPDQIRLSQVIEALDGSTAPVRCVDDPGVCSRSQLCATRDVWKEVKEATWHVLESTTLQNLVERQREKEKETIGAPMYSI